MVSFLAGRWAYELCGVAGLQGSTVFVSLQFKYHSLNAKYNIRSPSMIANLSAAMKNPPILLTDATFGKGGILKCSPGGYAYKYVF